MGFLDNVQESFKSVLYSLTTNDHYAEYSSRHTEHNKSTTSLRASVNNSSTSLVDSQRSSIAYRPGLRSQVTNSNIRLQDYVEGQPPLPSVAEIWERLDNWLEREYPELGENLDGGATSSDLNQFEHDLDVNLPLDVRESYQIHDGQLSHAKRVGLIFGLTLLSLDRVNEESTIWRNVAKKVDTLKDKGFVNRQSSIPAGSAQPVYSHDHWIPVAKDYAGNNIAVDLAPGPTGKWGQIILFGRDFDTKYVIAQSWTEFLLSVVEDLEEGKFLIDEIDESLMFYEKGRTVEYLRVLVYRAMSKDRKAKHEQQKKESLRSPAMESIESIVEVPSQVVEKADAGAKVQSEDKTETELNADSTETKPKSTGVESAQPITVTATEEIQEPSLTTTAPEPEDEPEVEPESSSSQVSSTETVTPVEGAPAEKKPSTEGKATDKTESLKDISLS
ncbi:hypothetical protein LJB42_002516 [Komagataella kurtzmanii]|nr:hypothetical protein LJB42_002516 [Komagataella kurtzmanii]